ncbi:hypothetical protein DL767_004835 [Monosporascus sp. MG133]|nr:hypothetical protein DL767_004835 [Monosporascus sp. MG133]
MFTRIQRAAVTCVRAVRAARTQPAAAVTAAPATAPIVLVPTPVVPPALVPALMPAPATAVVPATLARPPCQRPA